eukprot:COSAG05_NODE_28_length_29121_cov_56.951933_5_plen_110_part_00
MAALVSGVTQRELVVTFVNLSAVELRELVVQAGTLAEHTFEAVHYTVLKSSFPGPIGGYTTAEVEATTESARVDGSSFSVRLPPGREIKLTLELSRNVNAPTYAAPWQR